MVPMSRHGTAGSAWPGRIPLEARFTAPTKSPSLNSRLPFLRVVADAPGQCMPRGKGADSDGTATDGFKGRARKAVAPCNLGAEDWPGRGWAMFKQASLSLSLSA
ncbi:hypothetical protein EI94DRAFT_1721057 [Lactarius quietus]|nr:hypothetical protein EI94DRAFT_1721057 [Lactarius quietus]